MRDDRQRAEIELMDQLREVIDEAVHVVIAVRRPGAVAMPAQVGGDDMITALQLFGDPVPVAAMVAAAVDEQPWRGAAVAPVDIVQLQPMRDEAVRGGAGACPRIILAVCSSFNRRLVSIARKRLVEGKDVS